MEQSPLFLSYSWVWIFVALVSAAFVTGCLCPRRGYIFFIMGALGLTGLLIFVTLYDGNYLDVALVALVCLLPLLLFFVLPWRKQQTEEPMS